MRCVNFMSLSFRPEDRVEMTLRPCARIVPECDRRLRYMSGTRRDDHPSVTKLSITRFRPAVSKSISSLLPSISAIAP